ncbi:MAG: TonB family protein [Desulfomonilaceae bacterium]|nr:TonB family protein [Desulfomonilaceae bacterium]
MKKPILISLILVLVTSLSVPAVEPSSEATDRIVIDRTTRSKDLNDYVILTRNLIQRAWTTPVDLAVPGALKARIKINLDLRRSGALNSVQLVNGSGNTELDRSLLTAIREASPFPPFPENINAASMLIRANFIVADLPTVPVTTAQHRVDRGVPPEVSDPAAPQAPKRYVWGIPAMSSKEEPTDDGMAPEPPQTKKYHWGK